MRTVLDGRTRAGLSAGPAVRAEELVKTYPGDVQAVRGVSFQVAAGEAFGLLGPNGAGKTTTIGMLNTAVVPTSGRALLAGHDVARDPNGARAISSVVFQDAVVGVAKVLPLTHALALFRFGLTANGGQALHNIWGLSNDTQMAALSLAVLALYALVIIAGAIRLFAKASTK